jgi:hypothetical protein
MKGSVAGYIHGAVGSRGAIAHEVEGGVRLLCATLHMYILYNGGLDSGWKSVHAAAWDQNTVIQNLPNFLRIMGQRLTLSLGFSTCRPLLGTRQLHGPRLFSEPAPNLL